MRTSAIIVLLAACSHADAPVALVMANDDDGHAHLFMIAPGGAPRSIAATDGAPVDDAVVSANGRALAVKSGGRVQVILPAPRMIDATGALRAISDDGATLVLDRGNELVISRAGGDRTIDTKALGVETYGVALSPDGAEVAFSTFRKDCATGGGIYTCPVTLWIGDGDAAPRALSQARIAYDPSFIDAGHLVYMTDADDHGALCAASVSACRYTIHQIAIDGTGDQTIVDDAVVGRRAPDGTLSYHRNGFPAPNGVRSWQDQSLFIASGDDERALGKVDLGSDHWSPDGAYLLTRVDRAPAIFDHRRRVGEAHELVGLRVLGWLAEALPAGDAIAAPVRTPLEAAMATASRLAGDPSEVRRVSDLRDWLSRRKPRFAVVDARDYCGVDTSTVATVDHADGLVTLEAVTPRSHATDTRAVFTIGDQAETLVDVEAPPRVKAGEHFAIRLWWRHAGATLYGWRVFVHFDGARDVRFQGDHEALCVGLAPGDVDDTVQVTAGNVPGTYQVYVGWYKADGARAVVSPAAADNRFLATQIEVTP